MIDKGVSCQSMIVCLKSSKSSIEDMCNLIKDGNTSYEYNGFNQTTKVETFNGNVQINKYDAEGLRYEVEENDKLVQFIFNHDREVIAEKQDDVWRSYIRESELLFSSAEHARTYYHYASDEMGSITHITDGDRILNTYEYDVWGEVVSEREEVDNRFKFNGQQLDPITGQYYLRARYYNPVIGRFTQEDTYRGDGLNLYAYCGNNPVYYVDPTGHTCEELNKNYKESRDTKLSTVEGVNNIEGKYQITKELEEHITQVDTSVPRKRGIGGAHNKEEFLKNNIEIVSSQQHSGIQGIEIIEYQMPKLDKTGTAIPGEYQGGTPKIKTVYDPKSISTEMYLNRGIEAANNAAEKYVDGNLPREWTGKDIQGVIWRGYCEDGKITLMFPE